MNANKSKFILFSLLITIGFLFSLDRTQAQIHQKSFEDKNIHCIYNLSNGMFNGQYKSFYKNGKIKASGKFADNSRNGIWTLWSKDGKILVKRDYSNNYEYKQIFPVNIKNSNYLGERDSNGTIKDFDVKEQMIAQSQRIWRFITINNNDFLFKNNYLGNLLMNMVLKSKTIAYDAINDEFTKPYSIEELTNKYDFNKIEIIAYKIKEIWFFDNVRKISESRIIGICPVAVYRLDTSKQFDLFWLYYPDIRANLAKEKLNFALPNIKNLDDVFFFRYFSSKIYKEDNVYNKEIKDYKNGNEIDVEAERIMLNLFESEHDFWLEFSKK